MAGVPEASGSSTVQSVAFSLPRASLCHCERLLTLALMSLLSWSLIPASLADPLTVSLQQRWCVPLPSGFPLVSLGYLIHPGGSPAPYTSVACLGLSPKSHASLPHLSTLWSHGAPSSPLVQTEHLLPSPPGPAPPQWGPWSSKPHRPESPWTEPSSPFIDDAGQAPGPIPPPCSMGFAHLPVSPGQLPLFAPR